MNMLHQTTTRVNPHVDHTTAHRFGLEDATEGHDQQGSLFFPIGSPAWHAYNEGYAAGCIQLAVLTGEKRSYWLPTSPEVAARVRWNRNSGAVR